MDFQSAMETFAEAWVAASTKGAPLVDISTQSQALALTRGYKTPPPPPISAANAASVVAVATTAASSTGRSSRESVERVLTPIPVRSTPPLESSTVSPHSLKEEFVATKPSTAKSLPVHCVVQGISTLDENNRPAVQQTPACRRRSPVIEMDTFVIIPSGTLLCNLVQTALTRLGYPQDTLSAARGFLVIKNWKPLTFDQISDDVQATVGDILGELSSIATLKIQVYRGRSGSLMDIKDKLLRFLLLQSHGSLVNSGCPLDEITLTQICRSTNNSGGTTGVNQIPEINEETVRRFDQWWTTQVSPQSPASRSQFIPSYSSQFSVSQQAPSVERNLPEAAHPALQTVHSQFPTQKTRMRTSFDPELELPKLQRWFTENQHPSRQQIQQYVKELNSLESRRGRKPLDINNVVYWFKNARAAQKRAEVRNVTPNLPCHLVMNGYGNHHSPSNGTGFLLGDSYLSERLGDHRLKTSGLPRRGPQNSHTSDEFSNAGSDLEDEDMTDNPPQSPSRPLSLTTTRKIESREASPRSPPTPQPPQSPKIDHKEDVEDSSHKFKPKLTNNNVVKMQLSDGEDDEPVDISVGVSYNDRVTPPPCRPCSPDAMEPLIPRTNDSLERLTAGFPLVPNSMFTHNFMYMSQYIPGLHSATSPPGSSALAMSSLTADERRKRNRTFIDPVTEVPRLEQWFSHNTHPSHALILKYTEELNCMAYRQKFPRLESKNVQFWFKNRRAKCKRLKLSLYDNNSQYHHQSDRD